MAKGTKTGGRDFKPGYKGGPGRPRLPDDVKGFKRMTQTELETIFNKYINLPVSQLKEARSNPNMTGLEAMVLSIMLQAINKGDQLRMNALLDRLIGKVKERVEISNPYENLSMEELTSLVKERLDE